jgi:hypothetical protein
MSNSNSQSEEHVIICRDCSERIKYPPYPPIEHIKKHPDHKRFILVPKRVESIN